MSVAVRCYRESTLGCGAYSLNAASCLSCPVANWRPDGRRLGLDPIPQQKEVKNKYRNKKSEWGGEWFDSIAERNDYIVLLERARRGEISQLRRQVPYTVHDGYRDRWGRKWQAVVYVVDFEYLEAGRTIAVDTKGFATPVFRLKAKLFQRRYPQIQLIIHSTASGRRPRRAPGSRSR